MANRIKNDKGFLVIEMTPDTEIELSNGKEEGEE